MKRLATLFTACALAATSAWASTSHTGTITSIDPEKHQIVLDGGKSYAVAGNVTLVGLRPGDKVTFSTEVQKGTTVISKIEETTSGRPISPATPQTAPAK